MSGFDLRPLLEARRGKPTEAEAVKTIAVWSVIPAAVAGLFLAVGFLPVHADPATLIAAAFAGAGGVAGLAVAAVYACRRWLGFGAAAAIADAQIGGYAGLLLAVATGSFVNEWAWGLAFLPAGALAGVLVGRRSRAGAGPKQPPPTPEPSP